MPLNIREIFISDLDPNSTNWWSQDKLDKFNHNFRQLFLGGPQGPVGKTGFSGEPGAKGSQGPIGNIGFIGNTGPQGPEGTEPWKKVVDANVTLLPKFNGSIEYVAIPVIFGESSLTANPISYSGSVLTAYAETEAMNNLELKTETTIETVVFDLNSFGAASAVHFKGGVISSTHIFNYQTDEYLLADNTADILRVNRDLFSSQKPTSFSQDVDATQVSYNNGALPGYILAADNVQGDTSWRYKYDLFDALPVGSIVAIPQSEFNSTNFHLNETYTVRDSYLDIIYGRGKVGTKFEGWYLCNGKTWNVDGIVQYEVPNLNSFTYVIDANGLGQPGEATMPQPPVFIGGANISMSADFVTNEYQTSQTVDTADDDITVEFTSTNVDFLQSKNVNIIYLGINDMKWQTVIVPSTTENINLLGPSTSFDVACLDSTSTQYKWTGIGKSWTDQNEDLTGVKLYTTSNELAIGNRWYAKDGMARYWTGSEFTNYIDCPAQTTIELVYDIDVTELNGIVTNGSDYAINNVDFSLATTLLDSVGNSVPAGWYRQVNGNNYSVRRYWDGNSFAGSIISTEFVTYLGEVSGSIYFDSNACTNLLDTFKVYNSTNSTTISTDPLNDVYNTSGKVLVHLDWLGTITGESALIEIYDQNRPGASTPYRSLVDSGYRANIKIDSTLQQPVSC